MSTSHSASGNMVIKEIEEVKVKTMPPAGKEKSQHPQSSAEHGGKPAPQRYARSAS